MTFDPVAGCLEIVGQATGGCGEQPEEEESDAVDRHATEVYLPGDHHQINRIEGGKKQTGGDTRGHKGWPKYRDDTLNDRYIIFFWLN